ARRLTLYPPDLALEHLPYVMRYAEVDAIVSDGRFLKGAAIGAAQHAICTRALVPHVRADRERLSTEWVLLTSGTTGRPKMVVHTLASLSGAISPSEPPPHPTLSPSGGEGTVRGVIWGTFYDIRRYGGLQIFLRAVLTHSSLLITGPEEPVAKFLQRAGANGGTEISGTTSHRRQGVYDHQDGLIVVR